MRFEQISASAYAAVAERHRLCDANAGCIAKGPGVVVDTLADLPHAQALRRAVAAVVPQPPGLVINTHEDLDHVFGNQLFDAAEIIGHRTLPGRLPHAADPKRMRKTLRYATNPLTRPLLRWLAPGALAAVDQLGGDYDFTDVHVVAPTRLVDAHLRLDLDGDALDLIHVGPAHQEGDLLVHLRSEGVLFTGDVVFNQCTPIGWRGTFDDWRRALAAVDDLAPDVVVPGHGPVGDRRLTTPMRDYIDHVEAAARPLFDQGVPALEAAKRIDVAAFGHWTVPARLYPNVERAYRGFRGDPPDLAWNFFKLFNGMHQVARARGWPLEF